MCQLFCQQVSSHRMLVSKHRVIATRAGSRVPHSTYYNMYTVCNYDRTRESRSARSVGISKGAGLKAIQLKRPYCVHSRYAKQSTANQTAPDFFFSQGLPESGVRQTQPRCGDGCGWPRVHTKDIGVGVLSHRQASHRIYYHGIAYVCVVWHSSTGFFGHCVIIVLYSTAARGAEKRGSIT